MKNEFDNLPFEDGKPGSLGEAFGGFTPEMPEGSWEKLTARRERKKRLIFWWIFPVLIMGVGIGSFLLWKSNRINSEEELEVRNQQIPSKIQQEKGGNRILVPDSFVQEKETVFAPKPDSPLSVSSPSKLSQIPTQSEKSQKQTKAVSKRLTSVKVENPAKRYAEISSQKKRTDTKKNWGFYPNAGSSSFVKSEVETKSRINFKSVKGKILEEANGPNDLVKSSKSSFIEDKSAINPMGFSGKADKEAETSLKPEIAGILQNPPLEKEATGSSVNPETPSERTSISSQEVNAAKVVSLDSTVVVKTDSLTLVMKNEPKDSVAGEKKARKKMGLEIGITASYIRQSISVQSPLISGGEQILQSPVSVKPMWGGNLQVKVSIPVWRKISLYPLLECGALIQKMEFNKNAGASAPVKLIKTADGISGSPIQKSENYFQESVFYLPGMGLEAGFSFTESFNLRSGFVYSRLFSSGGQANAVISNPAMWLSAQYQIRKKWSLKAEIRRFEMKSQLLSDTPSSSQNLQIGLGLVWKLNDE